jgi:hypothetical protein
MNGQPSLVQSCIGYRYLFLYVLLVLERAVSSQLKQTDLCGHGWSDLLAFEGLS